MRPPSAAAHATIATKGFVRCEMMLAASSPAFSTSDEVWETEWSIVTDLFSVSLLVVVNMIWFTFFVPWFEFYVNPKL